MMPVSNGTSPLIFTGRKSEANGVPLPNQCVTSFGFMKLVVPASGRGLIQTIWQPRLAAF